jgi:hypothetical protein
MGVADHFLMRQRRTHVVDAQIESRNASGRRQRHDHRSTAGRVDQARDAAAVKHPRLGISNEVLTVREREREVFGAVVDDPEIESLIVRNRADIAPFQAPPDVVLLS